MALTTEDKEQLIAWAESRIGVKFRQDAKALGRMKGGELVAVVVYDNFSEADCNMHIASDGSKRWLNRELLSAAFYYPFVQLKLRRVTGLVPAKNADALNFDRKIGFVVEGLCRHALPDDDIVVLGMLREHCPWIPPEYRHA